MAKKDFEEIKKEVRKLVSEITEVSEDKLKDDAKFVEDLGVDSMMALEIVASIEKKYRITVPEEEIPRIHSLSNIFELLSKTIKG